MRHIVAVVTLVAFVRLPRVVGGFALAQRFVITILRLVRARRGGVLARRVVERLQSGAASDGGGERQRQRECAWAWGIPRASYVTHRIRSSASST